MKTPLDSDHESPPFEKGDLGGFSNAYDKSPRPPLKKWGVFTLARPHELSYKRGLWPGWPV